MARTNLEVVRRGGAGTLDPPSSIEELSGLWSARRLLIALVRKDLQTRYVGSSIGFFWTFINPILELVTYTFVFYGLIGVRFSQEDNTVNYVLFLFTGMVAWNAFSDGITRSTSAITDHAHLLRKLNFPLIVLPAHLVLSSVVNQLFRLIILMIGLLIIGDGWSWHLLLVPFALVIQAMLTVGLGMMLSTLAVYFRDMSHWVNAALMIGMFITPVFYPASVYPRHFSLLLYANPMAQIIGLYHQLILHHALPHANHVLVPLVMAVLAMAVGTSVFAHNRRRFADLV